MVSAFVNGLKANRKGGKIPILRRERDTRTHIEVLSPKRRQQRRLAKSQCLLWLVLPFGFFEARGGGGGEEGGGQFRRTHWGKERRRVGLRLRKLAPWSAGDHWMSAMNEATVCFVLLTSLACLASTQSRGYQRMLGESALRKYVSVYVSGLGCFAYDFFASSPFHQVCKHFFWRFRIIFLGLIVSFS